VTQTTTKNQPACIVPPADRVYVRSFLFSRRISAPLARVHLIARFLLVLCLSGALLRSIQTTQPDPVGASIFWVGAMLLLILGGVVPRVVRTYLLLTIPTLIALFLTWIVLNPIPGTLTLARVPIYSGQLWLGLAAWQGVLVVLVGGYFLWTRKIFLGLLVGIVASLLLTHFTTLPELTFGRVSFFHPLTLLVSDRGLLVAVTKVIGYSGMILASIALVTTARDTELVGALRQLRLPQAIIFFLTTVFRSLDLALSDYEIIRQAQQARAINARPRSFIRRLSDMASTAVPMVALMIRRSSEIADALLARGYSLRGRSQEFYESTAWRLIDWVVLLVSIGLLLFAAGPHQTVSALVQP
jgi:energy-coupling factor transporter transmembrane protein EcfT